MSDTNISKNMSEYLGRIVRPNATDFFFYVEVPSWLEGGDGELTWLLSQQPLRLTGIYYHASLKRLLTFFMKDVSDGMVKWDNNVLYKHKYGQFYHIFLCKKKERIHFDHGFPDIIALQRTPHARLILRTVII